MGEARLETIRRWKADGQTCEALIATAAKEAEPRAAGRLSISAMVSTGLREYKRKADDSPPVKNGRPTHTNTSEASTR